MRRRKLIRKIIYILFAAALVYIGVDYSNSREKMSFGVSFSKPFSEFMGLDWRETYLALLDDLSVRKVRLMSYWTEIEPEKNIYFLNDLDWQVGEAEKRGAKIILVVGRKQPRWPECHVPEWAKSLDENDKREKIKDMIQKVIERYRDKKSIVAWQVENEPLFIFGDCPAPDAKFLDEEIAEVRALDNRPIIITDSGERSYWYSAAKRADIFGTTLYRIVWDKKWGYMSYPFPSIFYKAKWAAIKLLTGTGKIAIMELQGEAWGPQMPNEMSLEEQAKSMDPEKFRTIVSFARSTGFSESYFWGVEYWYWLKKVKGEPGMWEEAKKIFTE